MFSLPFLLCLSPVHSITQAMTPETNYFPPLSLWPFSFTAIMNKQQLPLALTPALSTPPDAIRVLGTLRYWSRRDAPKQIWAPMIPMSKAAQWLTIEQLAVIETSPARMPFNARPMSKYLSVQKRSLSDCQVCFGFSGAAFLL